MKQKLLNLFLFLTISVTSFAQVANQPSDLEVCDDDNDGFSQFDLTFLDAEVIASQSPVDYTITYYTSLSEAELSTNALPSSFANFVPWQQTIYIRLEDNNTGSFDTTLVNLIVNPFPQAIQPTSLDLCDDIGEVPGDEITVFDLTLKDTEITGGNAEWLVAYYETNADAQAQVNVITNPTTYTNSSINGLTPNPQTLFVVVTDTNTGCVGFTTLTIRVLPNPSPTPSDLLPDLVLCDETNSGDGIETFDLTENELLIMNGEANLTVTYHVSENYVFSGSNSISNPTQFTNTFSPQTIYARTENNTTGCFAVVDFDIIVNPIPEVSLGMLEQNYCGFNTVTLNANSPFADDFIWYKDDFVISGESSSSIIVMESGSYQVEAFNTQCGTSFVSESVNLNLYTDVGSIEPQVIVGCTSSDVGISEFDLDAFSASLGLGDGFIVSYYSSQSDANQTINRLFSPYSSSGEETLIVRVEDADAATNGYLGCRSLFQVELIIDCDNTGIIEVSAFYDDNENMVFDTTETNFTNGYFTYELNNDGIINTIASSTGNFTIASYEDTDTYDINYYFYDEYNGCFDVSIVSFQDVTVLNGENISVEFPIVDEQSCEDISIQLINQQSPRPGFTHTNYLIIENLGISTTSGTIEYTLDEDLTINSIGTGSNYSTTTNANGFSLDFVNLLSQQIIIVNINLQTVTSANLGDLVTATATYTTSSNDIVSENNESSVTEEVIGSYDPNDKMESHGKVIVYDDFVTSDEYLYYTIRFQNVGTAEAITVRIEDVLDAQLDESTFQMLRSSHDYVVTRTNHNLEWNFENINLPAEQDDEEGSNGYVYFKIKPNAGYAIGDIIENSASIYFDFNDPIITNTFQTEFVETLSVASFENLGFRLFPNPAKEEVTIQLANSNAKTGTINILNLQGKLILSGFKLQGQSSLLDISNLESGLYFVELTTGNRSMIQKLIVN